MPRLIITEGAAEGLERCRRFLAAKAPEAAQRAGQAIERQFLLLETAPDIGRPFPDMPELRELVIAFGDSGYVAAGAVEVQVRRQHVLGEGVDALSEAAGDVGVAEVLAHEGAVLGLDQGVVVAAAGARLGEFLDVELVEQLGDAVVDVLRAVVGVKTQDFERRQQEGFRDTRDRADELELSDLVNQVQVVQALDAVQIALVDGIDADEAGAALGTRLAALTNGPLQLYRWPLEMPARRSKRTSPNTAQAHWER